MDTHALMARNLTQKERKSMAASPTQSAAIAHKSRSMARQMGRTEEGLAFAEVADSQALASSETVGVGEPPSRTCGSLWRSEPFFQAKGLGFP